MNAREEYAVRHLTPYNVYIQNTDIGKYVLYCAKPVLDLTRVPRANGYYIIILLYGRRRVF